MYRLGYCTRGSMMIRELPEAPAHTFMDHLTPKSFREYIEIDGKKLPFNFNPMFSHDRDKFIVDVDKDGKYFMFEMVKDHSSIEWELSEPSPAWVKQFEKRFSDLIIQNK